MKSALEDLETYSGQSINSMMRPCIYCWFRGYQCLYVGQSKNGLSRVLSKKHHVIGVLDEIKEGDKFWIFYIKRTWKFAGDWELSDVLNEEERKKIDEYEPKYNIQGNNLNEQTLAKDLHLEEVSSLRKLVSAKSELAGVLFGSVSDDSLLELTSSSPFKSTDSSADIRTRLEKIERFRKQLDRLERVQKLEKNYSEVTKFNHPTSIT